MSVNVTVFVVVKRAMSDSAVSRVWNEQNTIICRCCEGFPLKLKFEKQLFSVKRVQPNLLENHMLFAVRIGRV